MLNYQYNGPVFVGKASKEEKDLARANARFYDVLTTSYSKVFAQQQDLLNYLNTRMKPMLENPTGYSLEALNAMRTQATDTVSTQFNQGIRDLQNRAFVLGGRELPSGALLQGVSSLEAARAGAESAAQNEITLQDENLKNTNMWNAASVLSGNAAMLNPTPYATVANGAGQIAQTSIYNAFHPFTAEAFGKMGMSMLSGAASLLGGGLLSAGMGAMKLPATTKI